MPDRIAVTLRSLPDGDRRNGYQSGWKGCFLELDLEQESQELCPGALLEIECGSMLYWGELQERKGSVAVVLVEHRVDRASLAAIQETWS